MAYLLHIHSPIFYTCVMYIFVNLRLPRFLQTFTISWQDKRAKELSSNNNCYRDNMKVRYVILFTLHFTEFCHSSIKLEYNLPPPVILQLQLKCLYYRKKNNKRWVLRDSVISHCTGSRLNTNLNFYEIWTKPEELKLS